MAQKYKSIWLILLAAILGGGIAPFSKLALTELSPGFFNLLRFLLAACVLLPVFFYQKINLNAADIKRLFLVSLLAAANTTLFIFGLKFTTATSSQILYAAVPIFVGIISYFFTQEKFSSNKLAGLALGFSGLVLVTIAPVIEKISFTKANLWGNLLILLGVVAFAFYTVLSKKLHGKYSPFILTVAFVLTTILTQLLLWPFLGDSFHSVKQLSLQSLFSLFYVGIMGIAVYYVVYQHAIKIATPTIASLVLYLQPVVAVFLSSLILGEKLTAAVFLGGVIVFLGIGLITYYPKETS